MNLARVGGTRQQGVMLIEALLAILIFSIGILAVVGMQATAMKAVTDSKNRSEASFLASELLSTMWTDARSNLSSYAYPGSGSVPSALGDVTKPETWIGRVNGLLPGATDNPPKITVVGDSTGGTVTIQIFWLLPEETSQGLPPHNVTVVASIYS